MLESLLSAAQYVPHGYCLAWRPDLVALHLISDALIAISYFTIPAAIYYFLRQKPDFSYRWLAHGFAAFIVCCGLTHLFGLMTLWYPYYGLEGLMKGATAMISVATAVSLWPLLPKVLSLPTPQDLQRANDALRNEVAERRLIEAELRGLSQTLEGKIAERTTELEARLAELEQAKTDLTRLAQDNQSARTQAERADKSKTAFLRNVCHELRTPLNAILGYSDMMISGIYGKLDNPRHREYLGFIHHSGQHLLSLLTDLIDLDQIATGHRNVEIEPVDVAKVGEEAVGMVRPRADYKRLQLRNELIDVPYARADRLALKQVLINLLSNAVKYTPDGGRVSVSASLTGEMVQVVVADTGIGIAEEDIDNLGQVFVRGGSEMVRQSEGSGLGLALCRALLDQMGGSIRIHSRSGEGTRVYVTLPVSEATAAADAEPRVSRAAY